MKFTFQNDENSRLFCEKIVEAMELLYDIDPAKGCELLNDRWGGFDWRQNSEKKILHTSYFMRQSYLGPDESATHAPMVDPN
jgi:hypothetical protein